MYNPNLLANNSNMGYLGDRVVETRVPKGNVYLGGINYTQTRSPGVRKVAPAPDPLKAFQEADHEVIYNTIKPLLSLMKVMGIFPITMVREGVYKVTVPLIVYATFIFLSISSYVGYVKYDKVRIFKSGEGRFEEAVIDYLFSVYLIPVVIAPISWYESNRLAGVFTDFSYFESYYKKCVGKRLPLSLGNKPLLTTLALPILSIGTMVITHVTMLEFRFLQAFPYCYINTITYLVGGIWYLKCEVIGKLATVIADDFELALRHIGPAAKVAEFRSMWMLISKIIRDVGNAMCYQLIFLCLYLFLIITLTIYGLLSQIQDGLGIKDIGLTITAAFAIGLLYFICDEAHYASNCVRVYFQKKLLLVELSWMNDDAQQEINMFLRATEMNPTDLSLGGFFDVNRNLFKSLLATMVTYLVVLLQFQISIPEDSGMDTDVTGGNTTTTTMATTVKPK